MISILCFFGIHLWKYGYDSYREEWKSRQCKRCNKKQKASYDISYGETIWMDVK